MHMRLNNSNWWQSSFLLLFGLTQIVGQTNPESEKYRALYPDDDMVYTINEIHLKIEYKKSELLVTEHTIEERLYLTDKASMFSKKSVSYSSFFELEKIEASSYKWDNNKYIEHKVKDFRTKDELDGSFHDDVKSVNFLYSNLVKDSKTKLVTTESIKNPRFLPTFLMGNYYPTINSKLTLEVDKGISIELKKFNMENIAISIDTISKGSKTIFIIKNEEPVKAYPYDDNGPRPIYYYPHIIPVITSYEDKKANKTVPLLSNLGDLYGWYYSLVKDINKEAPDPELVELVSELTQGKDTDLEKVKAIYYWVQSNIKYIAFEYALGGFVPRESNQVFKKKYGDCKDNSSILYKMLDIAGLKGHLTWIGTRDIPYKYHDLPTPKVDNHMILTYFDGATPYFLDATGRYIEIDYPTGFIQGKEALVSIDAENYKVIDVPVMKPNDTKMTDSTFVSIEENNLIGRSKSNITGYIKYDYYSIFEKVKSIKDKEGFYNAILRKGNNKFLATDVNIEGLHTYEQPFNIDYNFTINDYVVSYKDEKYVNLNLTRDISEIKIEEDRETDLERDYQSAYDFTVTLEIPTGYEVSSLPENTTISNDFFNVKIEYEVKTNTVVYTHKAQMTYMILELKNHDEYRKAIKNLEKAYKQVIVLKQK